MSQAVYRECEVTNPPITSRYTSVHLQAECSKVVGRWVPSRTIRYWRQQIGVKPDDDKLYGFEEVAYLLEMLSARAQGYTIKQFNQGVHRYGN